MAASESVSIRLSLKDGDTVRRALLGLGKDGQVALARIEKSALSGSTALTGLGTSARSVIGILGTFGVGFSVAQIASGIAEVNTQFQDMQSALKVATGSVTAADAAFANLRVFAKETPFQLSEVTTAFIRLKNLGLDPSVEAIRAYGDLASSFNGKSVMDFIEAVADATTGEFERLKEFGIKASSQGDQVAFTFRGVTTEIGKNAAEIEKYLQDLARTNFGGAMAEKMQNLSGRFSNLKDAIDNLYVTIGEGGGINVMAGALNLATDAVNGLTENLSGLSDLIALVGAAAAGRFLGPMIASMGQAAVSTLSARAALLLYSTEMMRTAGLSRTAVAGTVAMTVAMKGATLATRGLSLAMALLGGPVGAAVTVLTGAIYLLSTTQSEAEKAADEHKAAIERLNTVLESGNSLTSKAAENARAEAKERLAAALATSEQAKAELKLVQARLAKPNQNGVLGGPVGAQAREIVLESQIKQADKQIADLNDLLDKLNGKKPIDAAGDGSGTGGGSGGSKDQTDKIAKVIEKLKFQQDQLTRTSREQAIFNALQEAGVKANDAAASKIRDVAGAYYDAQQAIAELNDRTKAEDEARAKIDESIAALAQENRLLQVQGVEREKLRAILEAEAVAREGGIELSQKQRDQIGKQVEDLERLRKAEDATAEAARDARQFSRDFGSVISRSFEDAVVSGEKFSDVLKALDQDIARIILRMAVTKPLENAASGFNWGGLFSSIGSSFFGGSTAGSSAAAGSGATFGNSYTAGIYHDGGDIGRGGRSRMVGASAFDSAPRLHGGGNVGLAHNERAIIALDDERVLTKAQQQNTAGSLKSLAQMALGGGARNQGGGENFTYAPVIQVDARNSTLSAGEIKAIVNESVNRSVAKVRDLQKRKGDARL
ncbi:tape measure protein [Thalassospira mesophila]|uniref:tape measure protein n=1 Tax=Thalassospira mesophila TaxID=1293891 RepID=UPI000A1DA0D7|nr:tape measure protein [Thalassospira mesophila]